MKKSELKTAMCVEMRNGWRAFIMLNTPKGDMHLAPKHWENKSWGTNDIWDENLKGNPTAFDSKHLNLPDSHYSQYDIVKVWNMKPEGMLALEEPNDWQLIFEE